LEVSVVFQDAVYSVPGVLVFCAFIEGLTENFLCKMASFYKSPWDGNICFHDYNVMSITPLAFLF